MISQTLSARLFGILFICSFLSYAIGTQLMSVILNATSSEAAILASRSQLITGGFLIVILHTFFNLGLLSIMANVLFSHGRTLSIFYLILGMVSTIMLAIGGICLLLPLSFVEGLSAIGEANLESIVRISSSFNFYLYQFGMTIWGLGGIVLCYILYRSGIVPRKLVIFGFLGYVIFIVGTTGEILGNPIGVILSIPGGLFEIGLSIWLILKGFKKLYNVELHEIGL